MKSFWERAGTSYCDSTSTVKLILYNATRAVTQDVKRRLHAESVGVQAAMFQSTLAPS